VEVFQQVADDWITTAQHPRFQRPYTDLVYQPMLEVMQYLRANGYRTFIVTGGGQDFVRTYSERVYGVPRDQVVGSAVAQRSGTMRAARRFSPKIPRYCGSMTRSPSRWISI